MFLIHVSDELPIACDDITAGEFLEERLIELGLLKKKWIYKIN